jgi:Txe/YoeB family toxin of Txe-Axe toxin-antitoxin module
LNKKIVKEFESFNLKKNVSKVVKMVCEKPFKIVDKFVLKFEFEKHEKDLNLKGLNLV